MALSARQGMRSLHRAVPQLAPPLASARLLATQQHRKASSATPREYWHGLTPRRTRPVICRSCLARTSLGTTISRPARRGFHITSLVGTAVDATEAAITQLHLVTHTPWFITIPLVAVGVNLIVRVPFSIHAQKLAQKRARLADVLRAWAALHSKQVHNEGKSLDRQKAWKESTKRYDNTTSRLYKKFGVQNWKLWGNIFTLPPWLVVIEALRRMSGAPTGLLGLIFRRHITETDGATTAVATSTVDAAASASGLAAGDAKVPAVSGLGPDEAIASSAASAVSDSTSSLVGSLGDPTLATGGCLWFPDLTVADPYCVLPIMLSGLLFFNVLPPTDAGRRQLFGLPPRSGAEPPPVTAWAAMGRGFQRTLLIMSVVIAPATLHFPSAIHLYWVTSSLSSLAITRGVRYIFPAAQPKAFKQRMFDVPWVTPKPPAAKPPSTPPKK